MAAHILGAWPSSRVEILIGRIRNLGTDNRFWQSNLIIEHFRLDDLEKYSDIIVAWIPVKIRFLFRLIEKISKIRKKWRNNEINALINIWDKYMLRL